MAANRIPKAFRTWLHTALNEMAGVVRTSGDQSIGGAKTFSGNVSVGGTLAVTGAVTTGYGNGAKNGAAVSVVEQGNGVVHKTILTLTALSISMTDATTAGCHGSHKLYDFPAGNIAILGATCNLTTAAGVGGISDTAALVGSVGTGDATLTSTEANIIPSTSGTLSGGNGTLKGASTAGATLDGTTTTGAAIDAYLNIAVPDAGSTGNDTLTVSGTITISWINLGDR